MTSSSAVPPSPQRVGAMYDMRLVAGATPPSSGASPSLSSSASSLPGSSGAAPRRLWDDEGLRRPAPLAAVPGDDVFANEIRQRPWGQMPSRRSPPSSHARYPTSAPPPASLESLRPGERRNRSGQGAAYVQLVAGSAPGRPPPPIDEDRDVCGVPWEYVCAGLDGPDVHHRQQDVHVRSAPAREPPKPRDNSRTCDVASMCDEHEEDDSYNPALRPEKQETVDLRRRVKI